MPHSLYTAELAEAICDRLQDGKSLSESARELNLKESTVRTWVMDNPEFAAKYARAREIGDDVEFERLSELASQPPEKTPQGFVDSGWVQWKRNQIDTFKWQLARKRPRKYGDKMAHVGEDDGPIQFLVTRSGRK
jgi:hypothetical protein